MEPTNDALILRIRGDSVEELVDVVASETTLTVDVNGTEVARLLCSPSDETALAVGFLFTEGLLSERTTLLAMDHDRSEGVVRVSIAGLADNWTDLLSRKTYASGCGRGVTFADPVERGWEEARRQTALVSISQLTDRLRELRERSGLYLKTGGVHAAALTDGQTILLFAEDIGRHNAVDKVIGKAFLGGIPLEDKILVSSGRVSSEIMSKAIRAGIPMLVSRAAPTCRSVSAAEDAGVTLIGFARGERMNIYSHPWRVALPGWKS